MSATPATAAAPDGTQYNHYPLRMTHPHYRPAVLGGEFKRDDGTKYYQQGSSQQFPPVTVEDRDGEEYYRAKGYEPATRGDHVAFVDAHTPVPSSFGPIQEYPKWVGERIVKDADEEAAEIARQARVAAEAEEAAKRAAAAEAERKRMEETLNPSAMQAQIDQLAKGQAEIMAILTNMAKVPGARRGNG